MGLYAFSKSLRYHCGPLLSHGNLFQPSDCSDLMNNWNIFLAAYFAIISLVGSGIWKTKRPEMNVKQEWEGLKENHDDEENVKYISVEKLTVSTQGKGWIILSKVELRH